MLACASRKTGDGAAETPSEKLYLLAAILIWDGLVDLQALWPHVSEDSAV